METMYDRLGDLLNETLQAGHVKFVKPKQVEKGEEKKAAQEKTSKAEGTAKKEDPVSCKKETSGPGKTSGPQKFYRPKPQATGIIIKALPPEVERACRLLGVTATSSREEIKKAYKEKLQYYHPDKHAGNPILEKIAGDKTRQVVEAYELISKYL